MPGFTSMPKSSSLRFDSSINRAISSRKIDCNSEVFMYLSRATRSSMRRMIFTVVSTPTSEVMSTSSRSSNTSASTVERPATARANFEKKPVLVFSSPASNSRRSASCCLASASCSVTALGVAASGLSVSGAAVLTWGAAGSSVFFFLNRSKNPIGFVFGLRHSSASTGNNIIFAKVQKKVEGFNTSKINFPRKGR